MTIASATMEYAKYAFSKNGIMNFILSFILKVLAKCDQKANRADWQKGHESEIENVKQARGCHSLSYAGKE